MGTKTVPNGNPHGPRDVVWGREVVNTVVSVIGILLVIVGMIVGAVVYNARQFSVAADANGATMLKVVKVEGDVQAITKHLDDLVNAANATHARTDKRLDDIEQWRYGQTISGWSPRRGRK